MILEVLFRIESDGGAHSASARALPQLAVWDFWRYSAREIPYENKYMYTARARENVPHLGVVTLVHHMAGKNIRYFSHTARAQ